MGAIISLDNPKIKFLASLQQAKNRTATKQFVVEGPHLVEEARNKGVLIEAYSTEAKEGYVHVSEKVMAKICNTSSVVSEIGLCKMVEAKKASNRILILDGVQDPGNLGALLRSARAFGFDTVVLGDGTVDVYNDKVIRASQGAIFKLSFMHQNVVRFLATLKGYMVYGTNVVNGVELDDVEIEDKMAIVLGNEGNGISKGVNALLHKNIYIPMKDTESLNVSVAGGIIMYKLRRD